MAPAHRKRPKRSRRPRHSAGAAFDASADPAELRAVLESLGVLGDPRGLDDLDPPDELFTGSPLHVILSSHAQRQLQELGPAAERALGTLRQMSYDEISWSSESLPPQRGREVRMLWAGSVRILFDIEDSDLTVQGFGLRPRW